MKLAALSFHSLGVSWGLGRAEAFQEGGAATAEFVLASLDPEGQQQHVRQTKPALLSPAIC